MKNIILAIVLIAGNFVLYGQEMSWVPSKYLPKEGCVDQTDCKEKMVCYKLLYKPAHSGTLTSYTSGFILNCDNNVEEVKLNESCTMTDKSNTIMACENHGALLLNCSGNTGQLEVHEGQRYVLHQICIQADTRKNDLMIKESEVVKLTTSIDLTEGSAVSEYAKYSPYTVMNTAIFCENTVENLNIDSKLDPTGKVSLIWNPVRETTEGTYIVQRAFDNGSLETIATLASRMHKELPGFQYEIDNQLDEYGQYEYQVRYEVPNGNDLVSNRVSVIYNDVKLAFTVTPNPAVDQIRIYVTAAKDQVEMKLVDGSGKLVKRNNIPSNINTDVNISDLLSGVYNIIIYDGNEVLAKRLIVIE